MEGYMKLYRSLLNWEWYRDNNVKILFIHCLLRANYKPKPFHGKVIERGSFVSSIDNLSAETGLSVRQTRTAIDKLVSTNNLTKVSTPQYTVFTVQNYEMYQGNDKQNDKELTSETTNKRQTSDKQLDNQPDNQPDKQNDKQPDKQNDKGADITKRRSYRTETQQATDERQTKRQTNDKQIDKQVDNQVDKQVDNNRKNKESRIKNITTPYNPPKGGFAGLVDSYTENKELRVELNEYVKMRKKLKKGFTEHALELKFKKLDSLSTDDRAKIEIVKQSTMNGWQDFYPIKNDYQSDWYGNKETEKADDDLIQQALEMQRKRKEDSA